LPDVTYRVTRLKLFGKYELEKNADIALIWCTSAPSWTNGPGQPAWDPSSIPTTARFAATESEPDFPWSNLHLQDEVSCKKKAGLKKVPSKPESEQ